MRNADVCRDVSSQITGSADSLYPASTLSVVASNPLRFLARLLHLSSTSSPPLLHLFSTFSSTYSPPLLHLLVHLSSTSPPPFLHLSSTSSPPLLAPFLHLLVQARPSFCPLIPSWEKLLLLVFARRYSLSAPPLLWLMFVSQDNKLVLRIRIKCELFKNEESGSLPSRNSRSSLDPLFWSTL